MIYVPFHVGDWQSGTRLMTPVEKGVYIDLIMYYYSVERPITEDECKRIARGYANAETEAMQYVLQHHFTKDGDCYRHKKCDEVLLSGSAISGKRSKAAQIRWKNERARRAAQAATSKNDASADANAHANENSNAVLTSNHKPVTITTEEKVEKEAKKAKREPTVSFPDSLPAEWRQAALSIRQDVTPERVFLKLRGRYAPTATKKTVGNWRKIFLGWIGREYPETGKTSGKAPLPPHKDPAFHFGKEYYDKSVNPDGTTNWGV